jgi:serine/threonine protein kinase
MTLEAGSRLGPYDILGPLGAGGMGEVYRARDPRLGRDVALKVLPEEFARDAGRLARFEREARTVAGLNHPNIVTLFSIEEDSGVRFLTMELVEGQSLARLVTPGGLPLARVLDLAIPLIDALVAAHEKGVVHRDLKPANVMVGNFGEVQVMDWGLAKVLPEGGVADEKRTQQRQEVSVIRTQRSGGSNTPEVGDEGNAKSMGMRQGDGGIAVRDISLPAPSANECTDQENKEETKVF